MKIVAVDNFDRDYIPDILICDNINEYYGNMVVKLLNDNSSKYGPYFYILKEDSYILNKHEP